MTLAPQLKGPFQIVYRTEGAVAKSNRGAAGRYLGVVIHGFRFHPNFNNGDGDSLHAVSCDCEVIVLIAKPNTFILLLVQIKVLHIHGSIGCPPFLNRKGHSRRVPGDDGKGVVENN